MLQDLQRMLAPAVLERLTLLINHVLGAEPVAVSRMLPHAGKALKLDLTDWPALLPPPPPLAWRVTPAGLLEWCGLEHSAATELSVRLAAANPAVLALRLAGGERPSVEVHGDAQFAADVDWLVQNLQWDAAADLERVFPPLVAQGLYRAGGAVLRALSTAIQGVDQLRDRWRPR